MIGSMSTVDKARAWDELVKKNNEIAALKEHIERLKEDRDHYKEIAIRNGVATHNVEPL